MLRDAQRSVVDNLLATPSLDGLTEEHLRRRGGQGEIVGYDGRPVDLDGYLRANTTVFLYRDLPVEPEIPFDLPIIYSDDNIIVVDKPHFLATMPRGRHVVQSALVRLRQQTGIDAVAPAHRLDRLTAGVLLFTRRPEVRSAYQQLFSDRLAYKEYRALAPARSDLVDVALRNRIEKTAGDLRARVVDGPVNAISEISLISHVAPESGTNLSSISTVLAVYRLIPRTGRTHQLRLHMSMVGAPIVDDPLYPDVRTELAGLPDAGDFTRPLRLVAHELAFDDPITGVRRRFLSRRSPTNDGYRLVGT